MNFMLWNDMNEQIWDFIVIRGANSKILKFDKGTGISKAVIFGDQFGSISYDPLSRNLFWVDVNKLLVVVHSLNTEVLLNNSNPLSVLFVLEKNRLLVAERSKISMVQLGSADIREVKSEKLISPTSLVYSSIVDAVFIGRLC